MTRAVPPRAGDLRADRSIDPIERWVPFAGRMAVLAVAALLLYQAASSAWSFPPSTPAFLYGQWRWWIITSLHEAGHYLLFPYIIFGRILSIAGGSFWQVAIPVILATVAVRQRSFWSSVYIVLAGVHLLDLSPYIYDAPYRSLPLLGGRKEGHDWHNLLIHWQALDLAEPLAYAAYYAGIVVAIVGLAVGVVWSVRSVLQTMRPDAPALRDPRLPR